MSKIRSRLVFLCFTNRSGSTFLAEALASGGHLNNGGEFFNFDTMREVASTHSISTFAEYLEFLIAQEGKNGTLVVKVAITQLFLLYKFRLLEICFQNIKFIFIERLDLLAQAISTQIAFATLQWRSNQDPQVATEELRCPIPDIAMTIDHIAFTNCLWKRFFSHNPVEIFYFFYEDFVIDPVKRLNELAAWIGIYPTFNVTKVSSKKLTNPLTATWRTTYLNSIHNRGTAG